MDKAHFDEMVNCIERLAADGAFDGSAVYIFAHCEASLTLADELMTRGIAPDMILDNSKEKWGIEYKGVMVGKPEHVLERDSDKAIVLIATRFYEAMRTQLLYLGFKGRIVKVVDYNTYSEYSLTDETIARKMERVRAGKEAIDALRNGKQDEFLIFCPFAALGDIYFCMSYLPRFMEAREVGRAVVCVVGNVCRKVAELFDIANCRVQVFSQNVLDSMVQATLYYRDENAFIAHQDRRYVEGSWTMRVLKDKDKLEKQWSLEKRMLEALDVETGGKYHSVIRERLKAYTTFYVQLDDRRDEICRLLGHLEGMVIVWG